MKHLFIPQQQIVFDYESQGDLFYMVIKGKVSCKVPFYKQLIFLNEDELKLFKLEYYDDILAISEATDLNKQLQLDAGLAHLPASERQKIEMRAKTSI